MEPDKSINLKVFKVCFYLTLISNLTIYIAQPFDIMLLATLASRCFMLSNLVAFLFAVNHSINKYVPYKTEQIITIICMVCFSFLSFLLSSNLGLYNYVIRMFCYLALPFYLLYMDYLKPDRKMLYFTFLINFLTSIVFTLLSFSKYKYAGYESFIGTSGAWLTLGYDNPNQTAMYLVITIIILLCTMNYFKKLWIKVLNLLDIFYMCWLLLETSSRTCIGIAVIILALLLLKRKYDIPKTLIVGILLLPAFFMVFYPFLYEHGWIYFLEFRGKADYSSRSYIFQTVLSSVQKKFLFGDFSSYQLQNLHNGILSVYSSLGLAGLLLFYIYYLRAYIHILANKIKSRTAYISFLGLLAVFLHACTESAFLVGGSMFAGSLSVLIFLVKLDWNEVERQHGG
ncbi:MAG TPA: hypothetical protein VN258_13755 [Mobilitalea sp.]|nr:hypothetical protein [Mobilitalea sp.]